MRALGGALAVSLVLLLGSLGAVVWRQSRALEAARALNAVQSERELVESEIASLVERIQFLESRGRVVQFTSERLGMRVPRAEEMVILPWSDEPERPR